MAENEVVEYVDGHYIVALHTNVDVNEIISEYEGTGSEITHVFESLNAFSGYIPHATLEQAGQDNRVRYVEPDMIVEGDYVEHNPEWTLDRISTTGGYPDDKFAPPSFADGVTVYVLDSGIRESHIEFSGANVVVGYQGNPSNPYGDGHGTRVAGCIAGDSVGIARGATLVDVQHDGTNSSRIAGMEWIIANGTPPSPVNMSVGVMYSNLMKIAGENLVAAGFTLLCSAGNEPTQDLNDRSPQNVPGVLVVGSTDVHDVESSSSNGGVQVRVLAPGSGLRLPSDSGNTVYTSSSGTSYSVGFATGVAALILKNNPSYSSQDIINAILDNGIVGVISNIKDPETSNRLLSLEGISGAIQGDSATVSIVVEEAPTGEASLAGRAFLSATGIVEAPNPPPAAPILISPDDMESVILPQTFTWAHTDPQGTPQAAYRFVRRRRI